MMSARSHDAELSASCDQERRSAPGARWASRHPAQPWDSALLLGSVLHSAPLVEHCHSRSGNETMFAQFCHGDDRVLAGQRTWLSWLDRAQASGGTSGAELGWYLNALYPNIHNNTLVNVTAMNFFWQTVPRRSVFRMLWSCAPCSSRGYRAPSALWAPSEEALGNPFRFSRAYLRRCNATEHPSCRSPLVRAHVMQNAEGIKRPTHFPGFFRALSAPGGKESAQLTSTFIADGSWVEVMRVARWNLESHTPVTESTRGQVWFWMAVGSGIWWNVGVSLRLSHQRNNRQMLYHNGCDGARKLGYDSIQLPNSYGGYTDELIDCRGQGLPGSKAVWESACPPPHVELRIGVPSSAAARHAPHILEDNETIGMQAVQVHTEPCKCCCDASLSHLNCGIF